MIDRSKKVSNKNKWLIVTDNGKGQMALDSKDLETFELVLNSLHIPYKVCSFIYSVDCVGNRNFKE